MTTRLILLAAGLSLCACGGGDEPASAPSAADSSGAPAAATADTQWLSRPLSPAEDSALRREAAADLRKREASMSSYEECMQQARTDSTPLRAHMEQACNRRRGAPKQ